MIRRSARRDAMIKRDSRHVTLQDKYIRIIYCPQAHFCKITLFASPASLIVCVSSSKVLLGKAVPIVYWRVKLTGLELEKQMVGAATMDAEEPTH